jgi:hypothetical protein
MDYYHMAAFTYGMDTKGGFNLKPEKPKQQFDKKLLASMDAEGAEGLCEENAGGTKVCRKRPSPSVSREDMQKVKQAMQDVMKPLRYTSAEWNEGKLPTLPADYKYPMASPVRKSSAKAMFGNEAAEARPDHVAGLCRLDGQPGEPALHHGDRQPHVEERLRHRFDRARG